MISIEKIYGIRGDKGKIISVGDVDLYFSYKTLVAFRSPKEGLVCCENIWGSTTGNHLNAIEPDHGLRYDPPSFMRKVEDLECKLLGDI